VIQPDDVVTLLSRHRTDEQAFEAFQAPSREEVET